MTPLDFFLWGHMKEKVYATPVPNEEELVARIVAAAGEVRDKANEVFPDVREVNCSASRAVHPGKWGPFRAVFVNFQNEL